MQICRFTLMRKALTLHMCVCAPLNFNVRRGWLPERVRERWSKTLLWKSNDNLKFKQMSKCTTESNVDESRDTFHFILRHEMRLTATKVAGSSRCSLLAANCSIKKHNNCTIAARILFIRWRRKKAAKANWLTQRWNILTLHLKLHPFWRFRVTMGDFLYLSPSHITWDWIYILFVLLLFGILCGFCVATRTHIQAIRVTLCIHRSSQTVSYPAMAGIFLCLCIWRSICSVNVASSFTIAHSTSDLSKRLAKI